MSFSTFDQEIRNSEHYIDTTAYKAIIHIDGPNLISNKRKIKYVKQKLKMLKCDFLIEPTKDDVDNLMALNSEQAIDKWVVKIIKDHWNNE